MRQKFREYYKHAPEEISDFWKKGVFSFDANVLLNLYRYSENTRNEILDTFDYLSKENRLWISYQAAFEYQKNRLIVINATKKAYEKLNESLVVKNNEINSVLNEYKKHQNLNIDEIKEKFSKTFNEIKETLKELDDKHPDLIDNDPIFERITTLLDGCIGDPMTKEELNNIFKEGKIRYEKKIPPGYMDLADKKNEDEQSLYGDIIIWKELIKKIKENPNKLIFITDDLKEDWWYIFNGKTIDARPELAREFYAETNNEIIIYKPEQFLKYFKENIWNELKEATIKEVEETRKNDEFLSIKIPIAQSYPQYFFHDKNIDSKGLPMYIDPELYNKVVIKSDPSFYIDPEWYKKIVINNDSSYYIDSEWLKNIESQNKNTSVYDPDWSKTIATQSHVDPPKEISEKKDDN